MKKLLFSTTIVFILALASQNPAYAREKGKTFTVDSPDKTKKISLVQTPAGDWTYSLTTYGKQVILPSPLGFQTEEGQTFPAKGWKIASVDRSNEQKVWKPLWGKRALVPDRYSELQLLLQSEENPAKKLEITVRSYDDGVAFRYAAPEDGALLAESASERTAYRFAADYTAWYYNGENHNIGPEALTETDGERMPVMTVKAADNLYLALHEACLNEGEPLLLKSEKGKQEFTIASKPAPLRPGYQSAWRVIFCGKHPGAIVDSHLLELLNPDPAPGSDFSWVKPGIALWDWRINGAEWDGFLYTMSYPSWIRMVDFAAEQGFKYLVLDANWYGPEFSQTSDPVKGDKATEVRNLIRYGKEKGVGIWLYLNDVGGKNYPLEETLKQYGEWGAAGVKYGFMQGNQEKRNIGAKKVTEVCAQNKLLVDFHDGPTHPYGQMRTFPNAVTREYCHAQLDARRIFYPITFVTSVFVNMVAGPIDMTNGMFDLRQGKTTRVDNPLETPSTVVSEAARTLITYSGVTILPDIPEYYHKYPELLRFLSAQKMPWLESKTLAGEIGEYIVMMRQASDGAFLVGAATNEEARSIRVPLSFLPKGDYEAEIVEDGEGAHYLKNRETYKVSSKKVSAKDVLSLDLAPGGGACVLIRIKN